MFIAAYTIQSHSADYLLSKWHEQFTLITSSTYFPGGLY